MILYFVGGCLSYIAEDLNLTTGSAWLPVANVLGVAAFSPFSGYLEDLLGRRTIAISGAALLCIGCLILGTAHGFAQALAGLAISGAGAGVGELTALAGLVTHIIVRVIHILMFSYKSLGCCFSETPGTGCCNPYGCGHPHVSFCFICAAACFTIHLEVVRLDSYVSDSQAHSNENPSTDML